MPHNLFNTYQTFDAGFGTKGRFYSLPQLESEGVGAISRLPVSIRIILESVLRNVDEARITEKDVRSLSKWEPRGEKSARRIHKKPNDAEVAACYPWLAEEITLVRPRVIVCLGATAAQALLGKAFRVTKDRGKPIKSEHADVVVATVHPSSILRAPDAEARALATKEFVRDLKVVASQLRRGA